MTQLNVKVRKLTPTAIIPTYATEGAAGFDLYAAADVIIAPGETVLVPLGLAFETPDGYEMQIRPRSGITRDTKLRIANAPATIDSDYRGEVSVIVDNIAQVKYDVERGDDNEVVALETAACSYVNTLDGGYLVGYFPQDAYIIRAGDRIAQGVIAPVTHVLFTETNEAKGETLTQTTRCGNGFGSSGTQ
jgi:dUTP pyrophosphatase